jgi:hypothetical protein
MPTRAVGRAEGDVLAGAVELGDHRVVFDVRPVRGKELIAPENKQQLVWAGGSAIACLITSSQQLTGQPPSENPSLRSSSSRAPRAWMMPSRDVNVLTSSLHMKAPIRSRNDSADRAPGR